jgi:uncharacterized delta-60 repeat protein
MAGYAASGDLDPDFGDGGKVVTDLGWGGLVAQANDVVVDRNIGRLYVVGTDIGTTGSEILDPPFEGSGEFVPVVAAYSGNGALLWKHGFQQRPLPCDPLTPYCANNTYGNAGLIHPEDHSLVVAGFDFAAGCPACLSVYVMRISPDGTLLTPQMGQVLNGPWRRLITPAESCCDPDFNSTSVAVDPDGNLIVGVSLIGPDIAAGDRNFALVRFLWPSGEVDTTFGVNGLLVTDVGNHTEDLLQGLAVQPDGKILAVGSSRSLDPSGTDDFALVRYQPGGAIDATFGDGGRVLTDFSAGADQATGIALQDDGKIVVGGTVTALVPELNGYWPHWGVARYDTDGRLDPAFGNAGKSVTSFHCSDPQCIPSQAASDVGIDALGRILLVGWAVDDPQGVHKFAAARYLDNGVLDTTFGLTGKVTTIMQGATDPAEATSVAVDERGIVAAGTVATGGALGGVPHLFALARYLDGADGGACNGTTTADVRGLPQPLYLGLPPPDLATFSNDNAVCEAVWVPTLNSGFVPQGIALEDDNTALVSGYVWPGKIRKFWKREFCRIVQVDLVTGIQLDARRPDFDPGTCRHGGGIAIDPAGRVWLADTDSLILLDSGLNDTSPEPILLNNLRGSFLVDQDLGNLFIGDNKKAKLYEYTYEQLLAAARDPNPFRRQIGASAAVSQSKLPAKPQGGDFNGADLWITSSTTGCGKLTNLGPDHSFRVAEPSLRFGPGAEEIQFASDGSLWGAFEAGAMKWADRPFFPLIARFDLSKISARATCHF